MSITVGLETRHYFCQQARLRHEVPSSSHCQDVYILWRVGLTACGCHHRIFLVRMRHCAHLTTGLHPSTEAGQRCCRAQSPALSLLAGLPVGFAQLGHRRPSPASCIPESAGMFSEFSDCPQHLFLGAVTAGLSVFLSPGHPEGPRPTAFLIQLG